MIYKLYSDHEVKKKLDGMLREKDIDKLSCDEIKEIVYNIKEFKEVVKNV